MATVHLGAALRQIHRLFGEGTLAGLTDARLLERYASERDETAFAALVQRHGPMVMAVCNGVLDDTNDADDAFQADIPPPGPQGGSDLDQRFAGRLAPSRGVPDRNSGEIQRAEAPSRNGGPWSCPSQEVMTARRGTTPGAVIHQEIDSLPERYRKPIVLCYLEAMTYEQAAGHLRWSEATTRGRLAQARACSRRV